MLLISILKTQKLYNAETALDEILGLNVQKKKKKLKIVTLVTNVTFN